MPRLDRTAVGTLAAIVAAFAAAIALRSMPVAAPWLNAHPFGVLLICAAWMLSLRHRIVDARLRRLLTGIAALLASIVAIQLVKYGFTDSPSFANRLCWYAYYVPLTWVPLLSLSAALSVGAPDVQSPLRRWAWLAVPALALSAAFLCNDAHQLAFAFPGPPDTWDDSLYFHGPLYFAEVGWISALLAFALAIAVVRCVRRVDASSVVLAIVPVVAGGAYLALYVANGAAPLGAGIVRGPNFQEVFCFMVVGFWEMLVQAGVIPANSGYARLFGAAAFPAAITDAAGEIRYETAVPLAATQAERAAAVAGPIELEGAAALHSMAVPGGRVFWASDLSGVRAARVQLEDVHAQLKERNAALQVQSQLAEEKAALVARARIYEQCAAELERELAEIKELAGRAAQAGGDEGRAALQRCLFLGTYSKRRANLRLVAYERGSVPAAELALALAESASALQCAGCACAVQHVREGNMAADAAVAAYDAFQAMADVALRFGCPEMLVVLEREGEAALRTAVQVSDGGGRDKGSDALRDALADALGASARGAASCAPAAVDVVSEDGSVFAHVVWKAGGAT